MSVWSQATRALPLFLVLGCASGPEGTAIGLDGTTAPAPLPAPLPTVAVKFAPTAEWNVELPAGVRIGSHWADDATHHPILVLDHDTGLPIAGATVDNWWEASWPHAEDWDWYHVQSLVTDDDGLAFARADSAGNWFLVQADGYVPDARNSFETEWTLHRATDDDVKTVEVRDWRDRPIPSVVIDVPFGCGHTANIRQATTDARGRATLNEIDWFGMSLWLRAEGVTGRNPAYGNVYRTPVIDGVHVIRTNPGPVIEGVVLDHTGAPAARAVVGSRDAHRGPWTETDEEGRFRLVGALPWSELTIYQWPPEGAPRDTLYAKALVQSVPGVAPTIRLPIPNRDLRKTDREQPQVVMERGPCALSVDLATKEDELGGATRVVAVRTRDGRAVVREVQLERGRGAVILPVDDGEWSVTVGSPAGPVQPTTRRITISAVGDARMKFDVVANPIWTPRIFERAPDGTRTRVLPDTWEKLSIITDHETEPATASTRVDGAVHVPATGTFAVVFEPDHADHSRDGMVILDSPPLDEGPIIVIPSPAERERYRSPKDPPKEGAFPESVLTVLLPDGTPADDARVTVVSDLPPEYANGRRLTLDAAGRVETALREGDRLTIEKWGGPSLEPLTTTISGPGPWTVQWSKTLIEVHATDEHGRPLDWFDVTHDVDAIVYGEDGIARLWRTSTGPMRLWIVAEGRHGRDVRLIVRPGGKQVIRALLRPDPDALPAPTDD